MMGPMRVVPPGTPGKVRSQFVEDLAWLGSSEQGRRIIYELLARSGALQAIPYRDRDMVLWHAGRQSVGCEIFALLTSDCPNVIASLLVENLQTNNARSDHSTAGRSGPTEPSSGG